MCKGESCRVGLPVRFVTISLFVVHKHVFINYLTGFCIEKKLRTSFPGNINNFFWISNGTNEAWHKFAQEIKKKTTFQKQQQGTELFYLSAVCVGVCILTNQVWILMVFLFRLWSIFHKINWSFWNGRNNEKLWKWSELNCVYTVNMTHSQIYCKKKGLKFVFQPKMKYT